ncbi:MAG: hypothetical protein JWO74_4100 [Solirubrobacterales bacterium]|nr:hypothetical protein [Solirubrobacterales bacterium]
MWRRIGRVVWRAYKNGEEAVWWRVARDVVVDDERAPARRADARRILLRRFRSAVNPAAGSSGRPRSENEGRPASTSMSTPRGEEM